jgi:hypothetical protein
MEVWQLSTWTVDASAFACFGYRVSVLFITFLCKVVIRIPVFVVAVHVLLAQGFVCLFVCHKKRKKDNFCSDISTRVLR